MLVGRWVSQPSFLHPHTPKWQAHQKNLRFKFKIFENIIMQYDTDGVNNIVIVALGTGVGSGDGGYGGDGAGILWGDGDGGGGGDDSDYPHGDGAGMPVRDQHRMVATYQDLTGWGI